MENYCAFSKDHKCILWLDYEITRQELEECHTLCHGNWIEIERKYKYIQELKHLLDEHVIRSRKNMDYIARRQGLPVSDRILDRRIRRGESAAARSVDSE